MPLTDKIMQIPYYGQLLVQTYLAMPGEGEPGTYQVHVILQIGRHFIEAPLVQTDIYEQAEAIANNLISAWKRIGKREILNNEWEE